ncbi:DUF664 domain-containing protein [Streptomyces sp. NP160]|uniref:mycothiol transferase n=1 Tax=Streptomyces sp. NP160 TaxID=2586637 RepID=UPI001C583285|nr:DUF664 domain-containing protein [Streptomyces sp. NP160]
MEDTRTDPPVAAGEAATLTGFLDFLRETVALKTDGLTTAQLHQGHPPSAMTLGGMLKHLAFVEDYWAGHVLLGRDPGPPWDAAPWDDDPDWDWHSAASDDAAELRHLWRTAVEGSRADLPLDDLDRLSALERRGQRVSVRYVLVHLVEEYARHAGHADLLREALDGTTGE